MKNKILKEISELIQCVIIGQVVGMFFLYWVIR